MRTDLWVRIGINLLYIELIVNVYIKKLYFLLFLFLYHGTMWDFEYYVDILPTIPSLDARCTNKYKTQ